MRLMIVILFSLTMLFSQDISEKIIVSGDINSTTAEMHLLKLKMVFIENAQTRALQEKYKLNLEMETLGEYRMVVIKPIRSLAVKNELMLLLTPFFPDMFSIEDNKREMMILHSGKDSMKENKTIKTHATSVESNSIHQAKVWIEEIGLQWIALLFLSITGLTLSLNSRRKMASFENIQKDLSLKQEQIENEIKNLGASGV